MDLLELLQVMTRNANNLVQWPGHLTNPQLILAIPDSPAIHRKDFKIQRGEKHQLEQVPKRANPGKFRR